MPKSSMSINIWISAFTIYKDIYAQIHPDELSSLLAYMSILRDLERGNGQTAFNFYDKSFRAHRLSQPLSLYILHSEMQIVIKQKDVALARVRTTRTRSFSLNKIITFDLFCNCMFNIYIFRK